MLKQIEDILVVGVSEKAHLFSITDYGQYQRLGYWVNGHYVDPKLPEGSWELIGLSHLLTSEQKEMVVKNYGGYLFDGDMKFYNRFEDYSKKDHPFESGHFENIDDSYQSWLYANGIEKNTVILKKK